MDFANVILTNADVALVPTDVATDTATTIVVEFSKDNFQTVSGTRSKGVLVGGSATVNPAPAPKKVIAVILDPLGRADELAKFRDAKYRVIADGALVGKGQDLLKTTAAKASRRRRRRG